MLKRWIIAGAVALSTAASASPEFWAQEWPNTNFEKTSINRWVEIMSGGPPKDGIPAIDAPDFIPVAQETKLNPREPVVTLEIEGQTPRAYPIRYLTWHEIVNDQIGDVPVAVTFCPLCNSALTFDRRTEHGVLDFGVSGKLRNSDMVMYDRQTESWWQQAVGTAIVGDLLGTQLTEIPGWMESWEVYKTRNPEGLVMAQPGWPRQYGMNPYRDYDSSYRPFLYSGELPPHGIPALMRVVRVGDRAWPMDRLRAEGEISEHDVTLTWTAGKASALDTADISKGKDVGMVRVRNPQGADLPHDVMFAFAFHAFWPEGEWMVAPQ